MQRTEDIFGKASHFTFRKMLDQSLPDESWKRPWKPPWWNEVEQRKLCLHGRSEILLKMLWLVCERTRWSLGMIVVISGKALLRDKIEQVSLHSQNQLAQIGHFKLLTKPFPCCETVVGTPWGLNYDKKNFSDHQPRPCWYCCYFHGWT